VVLVEVPFEKFMHVIHVRIIDISSLTISEVSGDFYTSLPLCNPDVHLKRTRGERAKEWLKKANHSAEERHQGRQHFGLVLLSFDGRKQPIFQLEADGPGGLEDCVAEDSGED
jgi:hypothetical protein